MSLPPELKCSLSRLWVLRRVWLPIAFLMLCMIVIGFILGNNSATAHYKKSLSDVEDVYRKAGEKSRVILSQCIDNNAKLTARLAELGERFADDQSRPVIVESGK